MAVENLTMLGVYPRSTCISCDKLGECDAEVARNIEIVENLGGHVDIHEFGVEISREGGADKAFTKRVMSVASRISILRMAAITLVAPCHGGLLYGSRGKWLCQSPNLDNVVKQLEISQLKDNLYK